MPISPEQAEFLVREHNGALSKIVLDKAWDFGRADTIRECILALRSSEQHDAADILEKMSGK